uniref:Beta-1,4-galactosyltransferase n=1 Tax=Malurus cyaneus samueli TaxID=2593467 RepID=A0A8C5TEN5_9PASS
ECSERAPLSVVPRGLLSFNHWFWHRLFWRFQNLPLLKPSAGIANLNAHLVMKMYAPRNRLCVLICLMCYTSLPVGALRVEFSQPINLDEVARINPEVKAGGRFAPKDCIALQKVAIIIPFRNREEHLKYWLYYLHPVLQRQQLDYGVYVINQDGEEEFNRAKLLNIGFAEALKEYDYDCFVFSDVDLIPMDDRNTYKCYSQPRHLSVSMDKFGFRLPYNQYFGGVSALSKEQFTKINGFPNNYWGWGGEDDDIYNRAKDQRGLVLPYNFTYPQHSLREIIMRVLCLEAFCDVFSGVSELLWASGRVFQKNNCTFLRFCSPVKKPREGQPSSRIGH